MLKIIIQRYFGPYSKFAIEFCPVQPMIIINVKNVCLSDDADKNKERELSPSPPITPNPDIVSTDPFTTSQSSLAINVTNNSAGISIGISIDL